jgi:hypothetical protein
VIDGQDGIAELSAQRGRQLLELLRPGRVVVGDHDGDYA